MIDRDIESLRRQAQENLDAGLAMTQVPPELLLALADSALTSRERVGTQHLTIIEQARKVDLLSTEVATLRLEALKRKQELAATRAKLEALSGDPPAKCTCSACLPPGPGAV